MTTQMNHISKDGFGEPKVLVMSTNPQPIPAQDEVLIRVAAAGVNRPDVVQRRGAYPPPPGVTDIPGLEVAGTIEAVGSAVMDIAVGDQVCALVSGGGYAEYVSVPAGQVLPIPKNMSMAEAAALPETFFTVWANVFQLGQLQRGETILIHGGSSGIGTTAIQLAAARGARVFTTVRSAEKARACLELGAEAAIDYTSEDFVERVLELTNDKGVDVILDMRGGDFFAQNMRAAAQQARLVSIASLAGRKATLDIPTMMKKRLTITGSTLRARAVEEKTKIAQELAREVWPLLDENKIKPKIFRTLPLADAAEAHRLLESNEVVGKVVLLCDT